MAARLTAGPVDAAKSPRPGGGRARASLADLAELVYPDALGAWAVRRAVAG